MTRITVLAALLTIACSDRSPPDVILISLDSVRADSLTFRDARTAPALTELAERGIVFSNAVSGTSWTLPAHVQMFSGAPPELHGVSSGEVRIDPALPLLPELLKERGYFTAGFFTTGYLWGDYGFARGFDMYRSALRATDLDLDSSHMPTGADKRFRVAELEANEAISSPNVVEGVRRMLQDFSGDEPLFLFLHFFDPHYDYIPPEPWDEHFDPEYKGTIDGRNFFDNERIWDASQTPSRQIGARDLEHLLALYRGEIRWTDSQLGEIFELLRAAGRFDDALIIVTADHGEEFFEHGRRGHRQSLYDELLRVPLLIVPPGGTTQQEVVTQTSLSDLAPTVLDYLDIDPPPSIYGRSLRPALEGEELAPRPLISSLYEGEEAAKGGTRHTFLHSVRTEDFKLVRIVILRPSGGMSLRSMAWYDLKNDPAEKHPVLDPADPRVDAAWTLLEDEFAKLRERWAQLPWTTRANRSTDMQDRLFDYLAALGYVEPGSNDKASVLSLPWGFEPFPAVDRPAAATRPPPETQPARDEP